MAYVNREAVGFTQLYPMFSSVSMKPIFVLNDLYVDNKYRNQGIGAALLNRAKQLCKEKKYRGLALQTAFTNPAQKLYEKLDWEKEPFLSYFWVNHSK